MIQAKTALTVDQDGLRFAVSGNDLHLRQRVFSWSQTIGVTIDGGEVFKNKIAAVLAFGVLGGLAAKGGTSRAFLAARRNDGATAYFQFENVGSQALRAKVAPILFKVGVPFLDDPLASGPDSTAQPVNQLSVADELAKLAQLRDSGVLNDDEFAAQKAKLLA